MNHELDIKAFFALVRIGLWGHTETTDSTEDLVSWEGVDWSEVYRFAEEQSVIGLIASGIEAVQGSWTNQATKPSAGSKVQVFPPVPQEWALQFVGQTLQIEQRNKTMNQFIARLVSEMRNAGIYTLLVKGQGVAQCYEKPLWRACGDVDYFLSDDNYEKAKEFLLPRASSVEPEGVYGRHLGMTIDGWAVELHGTLHTGLSARVDRTLDEIQNVTFYGGSVSSWNNDGVQVFKLSKENEVFYVFAHFLGHFYKGGIGLRQICDWCRLLYTYRESLDYGLLESRIRKAGLMSEWKAFYNLASRYLGMPDLDSRFMFQDSRFDKKAERIKEFILEVGNFGHNRDMSYYDKNPYVVRKSISAWWRVKDLYRHAMIFPLDSLRFFPNIMFNGLRSAMRGE